MQVVEEVLGWNLPLGQVLQVPESSYFPLGHAVQAVGEVEPAAEVYPAAQPVQVVEKVLGWNLPLGQVLQVPEPVLGLNVPVVHAVQVAEVVQVSVKVKYEYVQVAVE